MRFYFRTLLIGLAIGPQVLAALWLYRDVLAAFMAGIATVAAVEWFGSIACNHKPTN